jgi:predicted transcriptional regulator
LDEFDALLIRIIEKVFRYSLGDGNAKMVFDYLEKKSCPITEIPQKLGTFSYELRRMLDSEESRVERSRASVQSSAAILEEIIVRMLCKSLSRAQVKLRHVHLNELKNLTFEEFIHRLKEAYFAEGKDRLMVQSAQVGETV